MIKKLTSPLFLIVLFSVFSLFFSVSCQQIQTRFDQHGLESLAENIMKNPTTKSPSEIKGFIQNFDLDQMTAPTPIDNIDVKVEDLNTWSLKKFFEDLLESKITFSGQLQTEYPHVNRAVFYHYQRPQSNHRILIFIPGLGVSDFAFRFLQNFFTVILEHGYQLIIYIPPYHMERSRNYRENYYELLSFDTTQNILNITAMVQEIRTLTTYLDRQGRWEYSSWGGSIGATVSLLLTQYIPFTHLGLMIPIVDFNLILQHKILNAEVVKSLETHGIDKELLKKSYALINPADQELHLSPSHIFIMAAEYDQLNSPEAIRSFADQHKIDKITLYPRSHSSILLENRVYQDYEKFLQAYD